MQATMDIVNKVAPAALILMMVGMGMCLKKEDFVRIIYYPRAIIVGSLLQLILIPLVGFFLAVLFDMRPELAVGLMILAACPGGPGSNLIAFMCRGDAALSVSLTIISSFYTIVTVPLLIKYSLIVFEQGDNVAKISVSKSSFLMLLLAVVPILIGMLINKVKPKLASKMVKPVKVASMLLLLLLVVGVFIKQSEVIWGYIQECGVVGYTLCFITMGGGYLAARLMKLPEDQRWSIAIEVGIQNGALAIVVATTMLENQAMAIPAIVYSPVMISVSLTLVAITWITRHGLD